MDLSKKTTVLFSQDLHKKLKNLAHARKRSMGDLIRTACEKQYHLSSVDESLQAVEELARLDLPVSSLSEIKKQLNPSPKDLLK